MKVFAIGDIHLPGGQDKPMDIFGAKWANHPERIRDAWQRIVSPTDWVLVPGDISWAMQLPQAAADLAYLGELPGRKIIIRGNHDYWWHAIGQVRQALPPSVIALQNDCVLLNDDVAVCGSRGWDLPIGNDSTEADRKIYQRELLRLEMSLQAGKKSKASRILAMLHFPPTLLDGRPTGFTELLERYGVEKCVYGHLHGVKPSQVVHGMVRGVCYQLVAADALGLQPLLIADLGGSGRLDV